MSDGDLLLRITIRCLVEDLGLDRSDVSKSIRELDHEVCQAFDAMRSQSPVGTEKLQPLTTDGEVYTLHAGRWRGATWHDEAQNAVWLLGCGYHRSGERGDVYPYLKDLDLKGELFPTVEDYEILFEQQDRTFAQALLEEVPPLIEQAQGHFGKEVVGLLAGRIRASLVAEREDEIDVLWLSVSMKLLPGETDLPAEWMPLLLAAFFPEVSNPLELQTAQAIPTRTARQDEMVFVYYRD